MGESKPETTAQLVGQMVDCLDELGVRLQSNTLATVAIMQMRFYVDLLIGIATRDDEREAA